MNNPPRILLTAVITMAVILQFTPNLRAQSKSATIDSLLTLAYERGQFNGSALVAESGKVIFRKGYGMANFDHNVPNVPDTKHRIASITKQFTAMLIMQLVERGKVKVDGKITDYLKEYRKDTGDKVTIHHLLTHSSGIPSYTGLYRFWSDSTRNPYSVEYLVKTFCSGDLEFEPGSQYRYNNSGYYILGQIIERVTGKPFAQALEENILKPAGMRDSGIDDERQILSNRSQGYIPSQTGERVLDPYFNMQNAYAAGAMYSTAEDLYRWDQALYGEKLISKKTKDVYFKPHISSGGSSYYGYGWGMGNLPVGSTTDSAYVIRHYGGINGYNTLILRVPETKDLVVLLNNTGPAPLGPMSSAILGILRGKPFSAPKMTIVDTLLAVIKADGVEAGMKRYHELKPDSGNYDFGEFQLNMLGYRLLGLKRNKDAIAIFQLNIKMFPDAFNPYDSLGEAYMIDGQKELAIKNYAKSLEMNPKNENAITMLKRIQDMK